MLAAVQALVRGAEKHGITHAHTRLVQRCGYLEGGSAGGGASGQHTRGGEGRG